MIQAIYPTTPSQQGFVLGTLTTPSSESLFVEQFSVPLVGALDFPRFKKVWQEMISSYEILRTGFAWNVSDEPRQVVLDVAHIDLDLIQESRTADFDVDGQVEKILEMHRSKSFDLRRPPLIRLSLLRVAEDHHVLVWTHHHAIIDGWSQTLLLEEMLNRYNSGRETSPANFGVYANWLSRQPEEERKQFWIGALAGHEPRGQLPLIDERSDQRYGVQEITWSQDRSDALDRFSRNADLTKATIMTCIWSLALSCVEDRSKLVLGVTVSGRTEKFPVSMDMVGPFINTIPFGFELDNDMTFQDYASRFQTDLTRAAQYGDCSSGQIHRWLNISSDRALFDSIIAIDNYPSTSRDDFAEPDHLHYDPNLLVPRGGKTLHPLALVLSVREKITWRLVFRREYISEAVGAELLECVGQILDVILEKRENVTIGDALRNIKRGGLSDERFRSPDRKTMTTDPSSIEGAVLSTFSQALGTHCDPGDNFISSGGYSIVAIELLRTLRSRFEVDLTLTDLLSYPTPTSMAQRIRELLALGKRVVDSLPQIDPLPFSSAPFPLTELQEAYWVGRQGDFELGRVDSHAYCEVELDDIDIPRLNAAWNLVIRRHEMLRSVVNDDGMQMVLDDVPPYNIEVADLTASANREMEIIKIREKLSHIRRDVTKWPLFTVTAAKVSERTARIFLSFDLLIGDALTWKILYSDVAAYYSRPDQSLPPLSITFRDYVLAIESLRTSAAYDRDRSYWKGRLKSLPLPPSFPASDINTSPRLDSFKRRETRLDAELSQLLRSSAASLGVTPSTLLLTIFSEVLVHFTEKRDILLNLTIFNRLPLHPEVNQIVGDFTSLSMTTFQVPKPGENFRTTVRRQQRQLWEELDHRLYSGIEVLRDIADRAGRHQNAQAPVVFTSTLELNSGEPTSEPWRLVYGIGQTPQVLLDYQSFSIGNEIAIIWDSVEDRFPKGYLDAMFDSHISLLVSVIREGPSAVDRFRTPEIQTDLLAHPKSNQCLHEPFVSRALQYPDNVAVITDEKELSYRQLLNSALDVALQINAQSLSKGAVAVAMVKGYEQIIAVVAALISGRTFVPIDPKWPAARISKILNRTSAAVVLTQPQFRAELQSLTDAAVILIDETTVAPARSDIKEVPQIDTVPNDIAYIIFTSGSSGEPKGVMIQHASALNTILDINDRFGVSQDDRVFAISPLVFDLAIYDVFGLLATGGAVVIPREESRSNPNDWIKLVTLHRVSIWNSVPAIMDLAVEASMDDAGASLRSLRLCLLSGDWIPTSLPDAIRERVPDVQIVSLGGATEASIWSVFYIIGDVDAQWKSIPYGFSLGGQSVEVLSADKAPCEIGVPGEIYIGGWGVADGYLGEPELTAKSFVRDRYGRKVYRTGDRGKLLPNGAIEFLGREDGQVKINGYRIELREVEAAMASIPGAINVAVVAVGNFSEKRLVASYTGSVDEKSMMDMLRARLPSYMIPTTLQKLRTLPLSSTGKVDRDALSKIFLKKSNITQTRAALSLQDEVLAVVNAFTKASALKSTNLLSIGLTSVDVIRLLNAVQRNFSIRPNVEDFYADPTVEGLSTQLLKLGYRSAEHMSSIIPGADRTLSEQQERSTAYRAISRVQILNTTHSRVRLSSDQLYSTVRSPKAVLDRYSGAEVTIDALSKLLGVLKAERVDGALRYLYPSAGGLYALDIHIYVRPNRIVGLERGLYCYNPVSHTLLFTEFDEDIELLPTAESGGQLFAETASAYILLTADPQNLVPLYGDESETLSLLNAGYITGLLRSRATEHDRLFVVPAKCSNHGSISQLLQNRRVGTLLNVLTAGPPSPPTPIKKNL